MRAHLRRRLGAALRIVGGVCCVLLLVAGAAGVAIAAVSPPFKGHPLAGANPLEGVNQGLTADEWFKKDIGVYGAAPSDAAWQLFEKADKLKPGAYATLDAKALKLTGGPTSPQPPPGRSIYAVLIAERKADIFLTYCTNAAQAARETAGARVVAIPEALAVGASYALTVVDPSQPGAERFALFVLSIRGQEILAQQGFTPVGAP